MPLINVNAASVLLIRQELAAIMMSMSEIDIAVQGLGVAPASIAPNGTLDFSQAQNSELIAIIAA